VLCCGCVFVLCCGWFWLLCGAFRCSPNMESSVLRHYTASNYVRLAAAPAPAAFTRLRAVAHTIRQPVRRILLSHHHEDHSGNAAGDAAITARSPSITLSRPQRYRDSSRTPRPLLRPLRCPCCTPDSMKNVSARHLCAHLSGSDSRGILSPLGVGPAEAVQ
jgi:hypothetical protein